MTPWTSTSGWRQHWSNIGSCSGTVAEKVSVRKCPGVPWIHIGGSKTKTTWVGSVVQSSSFLLVERMFQTWSWGSTTWQFHLASPLKTENLIYTGCFLLGESAEVCCILRGWRPDMVASKLRSATDPILQPTLLKGSRISGRNRVC